MTLDAGMGINYFDEEVVPAMRPELDKGGSEGRVNSRECISKLDSPLNSAEVAQTRIDSWALGDRPLP